MSKITNVYYEELDKERCNPEDMGVYYFLYNLLDTDIAFQHGYEKLEEYQISLRNLLIRSAIINKKIPEFTKLNNSILAISALKGKSILIIEY